MDKLFNLPDLLGFHIGNPLCLSHLAMLIIILVLVSVMTYFNFKIRYRNGAQYYPVLYSLFAASILAIYYYLFQADFPQMYDDPCCIGWYCHESLVGGLPWAIVGVILSTFVSFCIFIATMQIVAQLSVEAGMSLQEKRWKEWKWGLAIVLLGISVSGIAFETHYTHFAGLALIVTTLATTAFVLFKIIRDTVYSHHPLLSILIGLVFLLGSFAAMSIFLEVIHASVFLVVLLAASIARAKARKKSPRQKQDN